MASAGLNEMLSDAGCTWPIKTGGGLGKLVTRLPLASYAVITVRGGGIDRGLDISEEGRSQLDW